MLKLLKYIKPKDIIVFAFVLLFVFAQTIFELKVPELFSNLINLITEQSTGSVHFEALMQTGLEMSIYIIATLLAHIVVGLLMAKFSSSVSHTMRSEFYKKVMNFSADEIKHFSTPSLITRTTNDISQVQFFFSMGLRVFITAPFVSALAIYKIFQSSSSLTWGTILAVGILIVLITIIFLVTIPKFKKIQTLTDRLNLMSRENLTGLRVIRAYNKEKYHEQRFEKVNEDLTKTNVFVDRMMSLLDPIMIFVLSTLVLFIYWFGATLVSQNMLQIGDILAFAQYAVMVLFSLTSLTFVFIMMPRASVSAKRLNEVFDTKVSVEFLPQTALKEVEEKPAYLEFRNVSFKYPHAKEYVLKNISFTMQKGQTVAVIGSTGSVKSTLINLLVRFYDCTEGQILLEGQDIKNFDKQTLLARFGYVPQKGLLFSGTIESNLRLGKQDATEEELKKACDIAQASSFVNKYDDGFAHEVAQGGTNFSGGQRQRLSIARALVPNPEILVFDDSFSALDYKTDKKLRKALNKEYPTKSKLIVAQRVGTIMDANTILVLEKGEMVGMGTHDQLMEKSEIYKEIATSQLGKEVLHE